MGTVVAYRPKPDTVERLRRRALIAECERAIDHCEWVVKVAQAAHDHVMQLRYGWLRVELLGHVAVLREIRN